MGGRSSFVQRTFALAPFAFSRSSDKQNAAQALVEYAHIAIKVIANVYSV